MRRTRVGTMMGYGALNTDDARPQENAMPSLSRATTRRHAFGIGLLSIIVPLACNAEDPLEMSGAELFRVFCASCHGQSARGNGPVAATLKPEVPDLTRIAARNGGSFPTERVRQTIDGQTVPRVHGSRAMPIWGWDFRAITGEEGSQHPRTDELIDRLVDYLASIQGT